MNKQEAVFIFLTLMAESNNWLYKLEADVMAYLTLFFESAVCFLYATVSVNTSRMDLYRNKHKTDNEEQISYYV